MRNDRSKIKTTFTVVSALPFTVFFYEINKDEGLWLCKKESVSETDLI